MHKRIELGQAGLAGLRIVADKLNRRAERHNMNKLIVRVVREFTVVDEETGREDLRYDVDIMGSAPRINGWSLAARIENNDLIGTVVRVVPGNEGDFSEYRDHDFGCDHCNTRRRRNDVFVLENDGQRKVVGRNCLADFLRTTDAEGFAEYAAWIDEFGRMEDDELAKVAYSEGFGSGVRFPPVKLERFLTLTSMMTRRLGWTSRTNAREYPDLIATADCVGHYLYGRGRDHRRWIIENELYTCDKDKEKAVAAVEWAKSLEPRNSEYLHTIHKIATIGLVDYTLAGFAASIIRAHERACEREAVHKKKATEKDYIGRIGERLRDQVVTVKRVRYFEGNYGVTTIVAMEASLPDGKVAPITWFASGERDYDEGVEYKLTGTIKAHDSDERYGKQTKVNRCKLNPV